MHSIELYLQTLITFATFSALFLILYKLQRKWNSQKEWEKRTSFSLIDLISILCMSLLPPGTKNGKKNSIFTEVHKRYLSSYSLYSQEPQLIKLFGIRLGLAVYDYESLREMAHSTSCLDRGSLDMLKLYYPGEVGGMFLNNGEAWRETKKYTLKKLGQLGFGKSDVMSAILADQLPDLLDRVDLLRKQSGNKIQVKGLFDLAIVNVIWCIAGGTKFSENDPSFIDLSRATSQLTTFHFFNSWALSLVKNIRGIREIFGYSRLRNNLETCHNIFKRFIDERKSEGHYKENPENFVDYFLLEIELQKANPKMNEIYCDEQLNAILQDLFIGGMDSTSKYLETALMFMAMHPEIQMKVQKEIDNVLGSSSFPLYSKYRKSMPYTIATMMEIHRNAFIVPMTPRYSTEAFSIGRHHIQKETIIGLIYYAPNFDETYWGDVDVFRPERFLDDNGNIIQERINRLLLFGQGPRTCPGENVSMSSSFTMFIGLLRQYRVSKGVNSEILGIKETFGLINGPDPFHISISER